MKWPEGSWILSGILGDKWTRRIGSIFTFAVLIGLLISGAGMIIHAHWWVPLTIIMLVLFHADNFYGMVNSLTLMVKDLLE